MLANQVNKLLVSQKELDRTLQQVGHVQESLLDEDKGLLVGLENQVDKLFEGIYSAASRNNGSGDGSATTTSGIGMGGSMLSADDADYEREKAYNIAMECQSRLNQIDKSATELEKELGELQGNCFKNGMMDEDGSSSGELASIVETMNLHHDTLRGLDQTCRKMENDLGMIDQTIGQR